MCIDRYFVKEMDLCYSRIFKSAVFAMNNAYFAILENF